MERAFVEAKAQVESGAVDCGDSDDEEHSREVSSVLSDYSDHIVTISTQAEGYVSDTSDGEYNDRVILSQCVCICVPSIMFSGPAEAIHRHNYVWWELISMPHI